IGHVNVAGIAFPCDTVRLNYAALGFVAAAEDEEITECAGFAIRRSPFFNRVLQTQKVDILDRMAELIDKEPELRRLRERWPFVTNFTMRHSIAALAQHHGVPTRLLDWSYDARKAAYFACQAVPEDCLSRDDKRIAVFALNPFMLKNRFPNEDSLLLDIAN